MLALFGIARLNYFYGVWKDMQFGTIIGNFKEPSS